jgi:LuxR family maltose regulon positive regulatory protein
VSIVVTEPGSEGVVPRATTARVPRRYAHRERLDDRFDSAARVMLVVAPAGTGKTTALAGWLATSTDPTHWVDVAPEAPADALWHEIADVFGVGTPCAGEGVPARGAPIGDVVIGLIEALEHTLDREHVLVIDGFDGDNGDSADALRLFLQRLPSNLRVVISTRHPVPIPLDGPPIHVDRVDGRTRPTRSRCR